MHQDRWRQGRGGERHDIRRHHCCYAATAFGDTGHRQLLSSRWQGLRVSGTNLVDSKGRIVKLRGVNYFGFNNGQTAPDGLWAGSSSLTQDFGTVVCRLKFLGFNAVRLPISFADLKLKPRTFNWGCSRLSGAAIAASVSRGGSTSSKLAAATCRTTVAAGVCNHGMPNDSTARRLVWVVQYFARAGFWVLLDNHTEDLTPIKAGPAGFAAQWAALVKAICKDPVACAKLSVDILNEPDNRQLGWAAKKGRPSLASLYLRTMDAVYKVNPHILFFIEGAGDKNNGANPGDGFVTDAQLIRQRHLQDSNPFFKALVKKPYRHNVVASPHLYPAGVIPYHVPATFMEGAGLVKRLTQSFGYLTVQGYKGLKLPIAVGEISYAAMHKAGDVPNGVTMPQFAKYMNNGNSGHKAIHSWFHWSWNANSPDTINILENDWTTINFATIAYLKTIGLKPLY